MKFYRRHHLTQRIGILLVLMYAFGLRLYQLDSLLYTHDYGVPYGLGVRIVEWLRAGEWGALPLQSFASGVALPNPPAMSYFWALVAWLGHDPYAAAVISVMLNVIGVGALYALTAYLFDRRMALIAAFIMASSSSSIFYARGSWMQGQLESFACISAWLVWVALRAQRPKRLVIGFALTSIFAQTYLAAFGLIAQIALSTLLVWSGLRAELRRAALVGFLMCFVSAAIYTGSIYLNGAPSQETLSRVTTRELSTALTISNPWGLNLDVTSFANALDFTTIFELRRDDLNSWTAIVPHMLALLLLGTVVLGAVSSAWRARADRRLRMLLVWFVVPPLVAFLSAIVLPKFGLSGKQYMLLASPAGYVVAALGATLCTNWFASRLRAFRVAWLLLGAALIIALFSFAGVVNLTRAELQKPPDATWFELLSLRYQRTFANTWKNDCASIVNPQHVLWQTGLLDGSAKAQQGRAQITRASFVWQVSASGGQCLTLTQDEPAPPLADLILRQDISGVALLTYRSRVIANDAQLISALNLSAIESTRLNLGWRLVGSAAPIAAQRGETLFITHAWRIDSIPPEIKPDACYSLFAKWHDANQRTFDALMAAESAPLVCAQHWRVGDYIVSRQAISVPSQMAVGAAQLEVTLFDAHAGKNAAYLLEDGSVRVAKNFTIQIMP